MLRHAVVFFGLLMSSSSGFSAVPQPAMEVVGFKVSGWVTLCEGSGCNAYIRPSASEPLPGEASLPPEDPGAASVEMVCSGDVITRETQVWLAYRAIMLVRYGARAAREDINNIHREFLILFSNGSVGRYQRSDSEFRSSHGMDEIEAPNCG